MELKSMGFTEGLIYSVGQPKDGVEKIFDWDKAAHLIVENGLIHVSAGLAEDWDWTSGKILQNGEIVPEEDTYTFLKSYWATPVLVDDISEDVYECWTTETEWDSKTYWPQSARDILDKSDEAC